ncbi:MAG: 4'-phosphopantetheinyl transferase superfamily protein [Acidimicrobiales bacterium]|nr:4'-phosphopantetheinyl transferase superfamily protein [Acidimicrobiales bacterium]
MRVLLATLGAGDPSVLSAAERTRAGRLRRPVVRRRYVAARSWLREVLSVELGCAPDAVDLRVEPGGRPYVPGGPWFSLGHCDDVAAVAVARRPVGIDVEVVAADRWDRAAAALVLSAEELAVVHRAAAGERDATFFACWTRKEAWAKLTGRGLTDDLPALTLLDGRVPGTDVRVRTVCIRTPWAADALVVSVAAPGDDWRLEPTIGGAVAASP